MGVSEAGWCAERLCWALPMGMKSLVVRYAGGGGWGTQERFKEPKKEARNLGSGIQLDLSCIGSCELVLSSSALAMRLLGCEHLGPSLSQESQLPEKSGQKAGRLQGYASGLTAEWR